MKPTTVVSLQSFYRAQLYAALGIARILAAVAPTEVDFQHKARIIATIDHLVRVAKLSETRLIETCVPLRIIGGPGITLRAWLLELCLMRPACAVLERGVSALQWLFQPAIERHLAALDLPAQARDADTLRACQHELSAITTPPAPASASVLFMLDEPWDPMGAAAGPLPTFDVTDRVYPGRDRRIAGAVKVERPLDRAERVCEFLHSNLQIEFVATDMALRNMCDFSGLPTDFYVDMAGHAFDEVRHVQMLLTALQRFGKSMGDYPFEHIDRYEVMVRGDLVHRLIILSRVGEAEAIDVTDSITDELAAHGFVAEATMLAHARLDEIRHVAIANRWLRALVADDAELSAAVERALQEDNSEGRRRGLPKRERHGDPMDWSRPFMIDPLARELAGFTQQEIARMQRAGS